MEKLEDILAWIQDLNSTTEVIIKKNTLSESEFWFYDEQSGQIHNKNNSFFYIAAIRGYINEEYIEQPILLQNEIGYLGIISKDFDGITHYLMQAKIEPGNINCIQISPTIQATKSNFTQQHGGKKPMYLDYFLEAKKHHIVCDQIQSEQASRFYKKRNRNMIIKLNHDDDILVEKRFKWMTLSQIKDLMKYQNLVNMDTRTVLSCLPLFYETSEMDSSLREIKEKNLEFYKSIHNPDYLSEIVALYHEINNYKMFKSDTARIIRLDELKDWNIEDGGITCKHKFPYKIIFCEIEIEGREVTKWTQPLFEAIGIATFGLLTTIQDGMVKFLVRLTPEIGCFDDVEIGPTIQKEANALLDKDQIEILFDKQLKAKKGILFNSILSEEGGRFYHEENQNIIIQVDEQDLQELPKGYHLVSYASLNHLNMVNNCLNIQLRNLLSTMEV